jgi:endonuclease YncB( thermonuclease family)
VILLILTLSLLSSPLTAKEIRDEFIVYQIIDGDSLKRDKKRYRLQGIDAPELKQLCWIDDQPWSCGETAGDYLKSIQGREGLFCIKVDEDRYRRDIVKCSVQTKDGIKDVGSIMVEEGYALAYRQYSKEYIEEEKKAKDMKKGIWKSRFIYPWEWRRKN